MAKLGLCNIIDQTFHMICFAYEILLVMKTLNWSKKFGDILVECLADNGQSMDGNTLNDLLDSLLELLQTGGAAASKVLSQLFLVLRQIGQDVSQIAMRKVVWMSSHIGDCIVIGLFQDKFMAETFNDRAYYQFSN